MALPTIRSSWTLFGLISAFFDLGIAYFLLCTSAAVYFCVRYASVFGLCLPCPCCCCSSLLGYRNGSDSCFFKLLVEIPLRKIDSVHKLVRSRLAFSSTGFEDHGGDLGVDPVENKKSEEGFHGLDREVCCSSLLVVARNSGDREGGVDVKEKGYGNQKPKSGVRRRRRGGLKCAKFMSFTSSNSLRSGVISCPYDHSNKARSEIGESLDAVSGIEGGFQYDGNVTAESLVDERTWDSIELSGSFGGSNSLYMNSSSVENSDTTEKLNFDENEADRIRSLELSLEREKAACAALYVELEKERAAAATAADEAIAMILRLQKEKAAVEMEVRQDQRMTEEQLAYDEEEMNLLKEILIRKERENYFLENEVKAYKQMLPLVDVNMPNQFQDIRDKRAARSSSFHPDVVPISASVAEEGDMTHMNKSTDPSTLLAIMQTPNVASESHQSVVLQCQGVMMDQPCIGSSKCFSCEGESTEKFSKLAGKDSCDLHDLVHDKLPVHDVYVVDDNTEPRNTKTKGQDTSTTVGSAAQNVNSYVLPDSPENLSSDITVDFTCRGKEEIEQHRPRSNLDNNSGRIEPTNSGSNSVFDVNSEKLKLDMEVEWLREMLQIVPEGKEQLKSSGGSRRQWETQLKLPDDKSQEFHEMQQLHVPLRHASLPTVSSKVNLGKRHGQSMTWRSYESD